VESSVQWENVAVGTGAVSVGEGPAAAGDVVAAVAERKGAAGKPCAGGLGSIVPPVGMASAK